MAAMGTGERSRYGLIGDIHRLVSGSFLTQVAPKGELGELVESFWNRWRFASTCWNFLLLESPSRSASYFQQPESSMGGNWGVPLGGRNRRWEMWTHCRADSVADSTKEGASCRLVGSCQRGGLDPWFSCGMASELGDPGSFTKVCSDRSGGTGRSDRESADGRSCTRVDHRHCVDLATEGNPFPPRRWKLVAPAYTRVVDTRFR